MIFLKSFLFLFLTLGFFVALDIICEYYYMSIPKYFSRVLKCVVNIVAIVTFLLTFIILAIMIMFLK